MNQDETLENLVHSNLQKSFLNLLAVGAFLWFFIRSLYHLFSMLVTSSAVTSGLSPLTIFWLEQILSLAFMLIAAYVLIRKIWKKCERNTFDIKNTLIWLGAGIIIVHGLQFFHSLYITDLMLTYYEKQYMLYIDTYVKSSYKLIESLVNWLSILALLLLFVKWSKAENE